MSSNGTHPAGHVLEVSLSNGPVTNGTDGGAGGMNAPAATITFAGNSLGTASGPAFSDFITQLEEYTPTIPDSVTTHFLSTAGLQTDDPRIVRLVSLATQKFISDIANDALQHCKMRGAGQAASKKTKDRKFTLTSEDLSQALSDHGITLKKPPYYV
jgi:transcription initiation factor TFIID subunit 10